MTQAEKYLESKKIAEYDSRVSLEHAKIALKIQQLENLAEWSRGSDREDALSEIETLIKL